MHAHKAYNRDYVWFAMFLRTSGQGQRWCLRCCRDRIHKFGTRIKKGDIDHNLQADSAQ